MADEKLATLFEVAAHNALARRPRPGRPLPLSYLFALLRMKRVADRLIIPDSSGMARARGAIIQSVKSKPAMLFVPVADRISVYSAIHFGLAYFC